MTAEPDVLRQETPPEGVHRQVQGLHGASREALADPRRQGLGQVTGGTHQGVCHWKGKKTRLASRVVQTREGWNFITEAGHVEDVVVGVVVAVVMEVVMDVGPSGAVTLRSVYPLWKSFLDPYVFC